MYDAPTDQSTNIETESAVRSFGMLSTFPPTPCGIATFAAALSAGLVAHGATIDVVRCGAAPLLEDSLVVAALEVNSPAERMAAAAALNRTDVVIVQHEYGIYAGTDGDEVLAVMDQITAPIILIAHTVVGVPSPGQRSVLERACALSDAVVVMTETARTRLLAGFDVASDKVIVIPHGAATPPADHDVVDHVRGDISRRADAVGDRGEHPAGAAPEVRRPRLLTWGLLGPGKGIEWAIDAFGELDDLDPAPVYLIAGATHPKVRERAGDGYRDMLRARARAASSGSGSRIVFDDSYRDLESLTDLIRSADLVVLPYDSADQVTSGVLVDAVAGGRPVVSTAFPHAVELLASGAGIVVPQRDPQALAAAIRAVLEDPERAAAMAAEARRLAPELSWAAVAARYDALGADCVAERSVSA